MSNPASLVPAHANLTTTLPLLTLDVNASVHSICLSIAGDNPLTELHHHLVISILAVFLLRLPDGQLSMR